MTTKIIELENEQYVGCGICEIISIPVFDAINSDMNQALAENAEAFLALVTELREICNNDKSVIEILWTTNPAKHQVYKAQVHLYIIFRYIGNSTIKVQSKIDSMKKICFKKLKALSYDVQDIKWDNFEESVREISATHATAIVKSETCKMNSNTYFPYYYSDLWINKRNNNFQNVIDALSEYPYAAVSMQLITTNLSQKEKSIVDEMATSLSKILNGFQMAPGNFYRDQMAQFPFEFYNNFSQNNMPLYSYNIIVYGESEACESVSNAMVSFMQSVTLSDGKMASAKKIDITQAGTDFIQAFVYYPWNINSQLMYKFRNKTLFTNMSLGRSLMRLPFIITVQEANSFFRLPINDGKINAIKTNTRTKVTEQFSEKVIDEDNIQIGKLSGAEEIILGCPRNAFTKHALIVGTPSSGKTTFSINILLQFIRNQIPFLAIEPTKSEYRAMIDVIPDLQIFTPGNNSVSPFVINPFIPPKGVTVEKYIPSLANAFKAAFSMPEPLDAIFLQAIRLCYTEYGWRDYSKADDGMHIFGLHEFIRVFKKIIKDTKYSKEVRGNIESGGILRLMNLIEQNSNIYDTVHTVPLEDILSKPTVLELNAIDNQEQKALLMALLLINTCVYAKNNQVGDGKLKNVILIDEAHILLGESEGMEATKAQSITKKSLQDMIAEIRSLGTSIVIADQSPTQVTRRVIANTDIKISFRLVETAEKELIADSTGMTETEKQNMTGLSVGEAYIYYSQLKHPQMVITEDIRKKENIRLDVPDSEIMQRMKYWNNHKDLLKPFNECEFCEYCKEGCEFKLRADADFYANRLVNVCSNSINSPSDLKTYAVSIPKLIDEQLIKHSDEDKNRILDCIKIRFIRKIQLIKDINLTQNDVIKIINWRRNRNE